MILGEASIEASSHFLKVRCDSLSSLFQFAVLFTKKVRMADILVSISVIGCLISLNPLTSS